MKDSEMPATEDETALALGRMMVQAILALSLMLLGAFCPHRRQAMSSVHLLLFGQK